ncbi:MAG: helix-turn-helix domain-containing protein [Kiritimatiellia bacterium]
MLIWETLRRTNGNQSLAAELLGITRQTLSRRLKSMKRSRPPGQNPGRDN